MNTYTVLSEPARRNILDVLRASPVTVGTLAQTLGMSQPVVSKHLRILRDAGLVTAQPEGQRRRYHINAEPLTELDDWLQPYRQYWSKKLDDLESHLDETFKEKDV